jgi:hypothetical protein
MIVQIVSCCEALSTKFARPEHGAREMNVLHVFLQIAALSSHPTAQPAAVTLTICQLFNICVQVPQATYNM